MDSPVGYENPDFLDWVQSNTDLVDSSQFQAAATLNLPAPSWNMVYPVPVNLSQSGTSSAGVPSSSNSQVLQELSTGLLDDDPLASGHQEMPQRQPSGRRQVSQRQRRNAISARKNREKQKERLSSLNDRLDKLQIDKKRLQGENETLERRIDRLEDELAQLKSTLMNGSQLSSVLLNLAAENQ